MAELQSCASMAGTASLLCAMEHQVERESVNVIGIGTAEISAELKRERQKNAELMARISILEAQIRERDKDSLISNGQASCQNTWERKSKRQRVANNHKIDNQPTRRDSEVKSRSHCMPAEDDNTGNCLVTWMGNYDTEPLHSETFRECDPAADFEDTDDSDGEDDEEISENDSCTYHKDRETKKDVNWVKNEKEQALIKDIDEEVDAQCLESSSSGYNEFTFGRVNQGCHECLLRKGLGQSIDPVDNTTKSVKNHRENKNMIGGYLDASKAYTTGHKNVLSPKQHSKVAFCPKEVKKIIESEELLLKNAQSHTIRKLIVFASLGIRHGCEDMYDLDFTHFSILRKGEPYASPEDPGEHVLYENPGVGRKIFHPNRQNPTLCPVQILEEEKDMRPSDASCPSFLFLCIKYGGRTRNIPQNEYVRQRMGRNKLKSFGPSICQMALLVHIRTGSFFFKALGITLLFMAGFPDDMVQGETNYRNLDLLQKYYRTDEDAKGEELFLPQPTSVDTNVSSGSHQLMVKRLSTKSRSKKHANSASKSQEKALIKQPAPSNAGPSSQVELTVNASAQTQAPIAVQSITSQAPEDTSAPDPLTRTNLNIPLHNQSSYYFVPPLPGSYFLPMVYWPPPPNAFLPYPHPNPHSYRYPIAGNYISVYPQPYYSNLSCNSSFPEPLKENWKNDPTSEHVDSESKSSSSSTEPANKANEINWTLK